MDEGLVKNSPDVGGGGDVRSDIVPVAGHVPVYTEEDVITSSGMSVQDIIDAAVNEAPGDVVGPDGAGNEKIAVFDSTTGKLIKDGLQSIAEVIAAASVAPPAPIAQNSFLVSGGAITWIDDYNFRVAAATYYILGTLYTSTEQNVTLDAADPTHDRIDIIAVDVNGDVVAVSGTAAAQPSEPEVDPSSQLKLGIVTVGANTTAPAEAVLVPLYAENAGDPTEWDWSTSGSGWNVNSSNNPRNGTKSIEGTSVGSGSYAQGQFGSNFLDPNAYDALVLYIRSKATWANNRRLRIQFYNAGQAQGAGILLAHGQFGFDSSITSVYQLIVIPMTQFAIAGGTLVNQLRLTSTSSGIGFYLDDLVLQQGIPSDLAVNVLTQAQADARYAPFTRGLYRKVGITIDGQGSVITAGVKGSIQLDFVGTIVGWSAQADQSGSISVDVCKVAGTETVPVVPNTTSDKISASAPIALSSEQAKGVGTAGVSTWTRTISQWDSLLFNVTGTPASVTRVTIWVRIKVTD